MVCKMSHMMSLHDGTRVKPVYIRSVCLVAQNHVTYDITIKLLFMTFIFLVGYLRLFASEGFWAHQPVLLNKQIVLDVMT